MSRSKLDRNQLAVAIAATAVAAIVVGIVWGVGQQVARARQMRAEEIRLEQAVAAKQAYYDELVVQLEYVRSDEYVEQWAREDAKMSRPGEVVVVVLDDVATETVVDTTPAPTVEPESRPFWVELWELVFTPSGR